MKYFLIAGEASGDLHASHLIAALRERDPEAEFRFYGGDLMLEAAGAGLLRHYKTLAYMGFVQVALHARTILRGLADCKHAIAEWRPDCVILIDYPGFNLKIARWVHEHWSATGKPGETGISGNSRNSGIPGETGKTRETGISGAPARPRVFYYISPKIWAWKEHRIKAIRAYVDRLFSILPFEVEFYEGKHHYPISYVGNPTCDEVSQFLAAHPALERGETIALLPGSRQQEIRDNLRIMLRAVEMMSTPGKLRTPGDSGQSGKTGTPLTVTIAAAPGIDDAFYRALAPNARIVRGKTYELLATARAALVTSGTATLEAALLGCPQVVCYKMSGGRIVNWLRPYFLKCRWISLVNLIADHEVVPELIAADMTAANVARHLGVLIDGPARTAQLQGYALLRQRIGEPGAPKRAADEIICRLKPQQ